MSLFNRSKQSIPGLRAAVHNTQTRELVEVQYPRLILAMAEVLGERQLKSVGEKLGLSADEVKEVIEQASVSWKEVMDNTTPNGFAGVTMDRELFLPGLEDSMAGLTREEYNEKLRQGYLEPKGKARVLLDPEAGLASLTTYVYEGEGDPDMLTAQSVINNGKPGMVIRTFSNDGIVIQSADEMNLEVVISGFAKKITVNDDGTVTTVYDMTGLSRLPPEEDKVLLDMDLAAVMQA